MLTVRLSEEMEKKISNLMKEKNMSKSEIVKEALALYIANIENQKNSYETGKDFFGKYGSGSSDNSVTYKIRVKEKIREKNSH